MQPLYQDFIRLNVQKVKPSPAHALKAPRKSGGTTPLTVFVGPCHHGMARPQVADGGTASDMEGSCEYIEQAVADSRQGVVLQLGGWARL